MDLYGDKKDDVGSNYFIGHSIRSYYLLDFIGVWQEDEAEEAAAYGAKPGTLNTKIFITKKEMLQISI